MGKGRTWCISFEDEAKKDGDVKIKWKLKNKDGTETTLPGTWEGYKKGDQPDKKASRFHDRLSQPPMNELVSVVRAGNTVCFRLKDGARWDDINGVEIGDQSGQTFDIYDDDDPDGDSEFLETVRFSLAGTPITSDAEVRLGLGHVERLARVPTHVDGQAQSVGAILEALASEFNAIYAKKGYEATTDNEEVVIPKVPCKLGCRGGCDDEGMEYWLSMADPESAPFDRSFDKTLLLRNALSALEARLNLAGIPRVTPLDATGLKFAQVPDDSARAPFCQECQETSCNVSIQILSPPTPGRVPSGTTSIPVTVEYTAELDGRPLTDCMIYVLVEKIGGDGGVLDTRLASHAAASPATDQQVTIDADTDMGLTIGQVVRVTVTLVSNECPVVSDGPHHVSVGR